MDKDVEYRIFGLEKNYLTFIINQLTLNSRKLSANINVTLFRFIRLNTIV